MKNLLLFLLLTDTFYIAAQQLCKGSLTGDEFNANKYQTYFLPQGHKFQSKDNYGLKVQYPFPQQSKLVTMMASGAPWIGSLTNGKLYIASQSYISSFQQDYCTGPLDSNGLKYEDECALYDRTWNVYREDVLRHTADFTTDHKIDDTIASIFGWPGEGNLFFARFNEFNLPDNHIGGWAPFADNNQNGIYEPNLGEYPAIYVKGKLTHPEQLMWMVFNDQGSHTNSHGRPLGVEIQLTVYGYYCQDNELLNNSLFNSYKVINQSGITLDSLFFGQFHDYRIGCDEDDYVGCDTLRHTEFAYNMDELDGDDGSFCTSGSQTISLHTPVQSFTYLSHPMYSFIKQSMWQSPQNDIEHYRMLTGRWRTGQPITIGGNGQGTDPGLQTTRYIYHGDPRDTGSWSELTVGEPVNRSQTISSVALEDLEPGEQVTVEGVYIFSIDTTRTHLEQFDVMDDNIDHMLEMLTDLDSHCTPFASCVDDDCVWPGDFNHDLIVDHRDLLYWGVTQNTTGPERNGLSNWRGHYADDWTKNFYNGTNAKHQDADGNGLIDKNDLQSNLNHFHLTTPGYTPDDQYPTGNELAILSDPMDHNGDIGYVRVVTQRPIHDLYGIAFELEFDTTYFGYSELIQRFPLDSLGVYFEGHSPDLYNTLYDFQASGDTRYSFVSTAEEFTIPDEFLLLRIPFGLKEKNGWPLEYLPDQFTLRLKNLTAINKDGREIQLGAEPLIVYNPLITSTNSLQTNSLKIFPNPCHESFIVQSDIAGDLDIVNIQGKMMKTVGANELSSPVRVEDLMPGMYFLRQSGSQTISKLIIQ